MDEHDIGSLKTITKEAKDFKAQNNYPETLKCLPKKPENKVPASIIKEARIEVSEVK